MKIKSPRLLILLAGLFLGCTAFLRAADPSKEDTTLATALIAALEKADYAAFIAPGEPQFKQLTQAQFDSVVAKLAPRFKVSHVLLYLGEVKQNGYHVTLWKMTFNDGSDDALVTLSVKDGKVGGFFIR